MPRPSLRAPRLLNLWAVCAMFVFFVVFVLALGIFDDVGVLLVVPDSPENAASMANALSRASVTLISAVLASLFLAIPLTANMYTPQLISLFIRSWTHRLVLFLFVASAFHSVWMCRLINSSKSPQVHLTVSLWLFTLSIAVLLPYLYSVLRSLDPDEIVRRVAALLAQSLKPGKSTPKAKRALASQIHQLGNIGLKAIDRSDRDVALSVTNALAECAHRYQDLRELHPPEWFEIDNEHFPGLSAEAIDLVNTERNWVEMEILAQLARAHDTSLRKLPTVISAVSRTVRHFAVTALEYNNRGGLLISIRYLNNFLRQAAKERAIHALYDVIFQYRTLALAIWEKEPDCVVSIAKYLDYYGRTAAEGGTPFAQELVAYDLGAVIATLTERNRPQMEVLLERFVKIEQPGPAERAVSPGILKARLILASALRERGEDERAQRVEMSLDPLPSSFLERIGTELAAETDAVYWEVTARQQNLDFVPEPQRRRIAEILERLIAASSKT